MFPRRSLHVVVSVILAFVGVPFVLSQQPGKAAPPPPPAGARPPQLTGAQILEMKLAFLPRVVAKYDKTEITAEEFRKMAAPQLIQYIMRNPNLPKERLLALVEAVLRDYVDRRLLANEARKAGFQPDLVKAQTKLEELAKRFGGMQALEKILNWQGLTVKDAVRQIAMDMAVSEWVEKKIRPTVKISDEDIRKYYEEHRKEFFEPEKVQASHILVESRDSDTPEQKAKAKAEAERLLAQLKEGADFAELAKKHSACPSAAKGGDLGYFGHGEMVPEFDKAAFALKEGELSDVVHTQFGYHIIKGGKHKPAHEQAFPAVRDVIRRKLERRALVERLKKEIEAARAREHVQILIQTPSAPRPQPAKP